MLTDKMGLRSIGCVLGASAFAIRAAGGDLTPPTGPVASTMKKISEVEPRVAINATNTPGDSDSMFKITASGSYYLTSLILVGPGKMGIEIAADDVTIDLSGYRIAGIAGTLSGISLVSDRRNITIRNGVLENLQAHGIDLDPASVIVEGCLIENILVQDCSLGGVRVGDGAVIRGVASIRNAQSGISAGEGAALVECTASSNGTIGFAISGGSVTGCVATRNGSQGFNGVFATINNCSAIRNEGGGFEGGYGATFFNCSAYMNSGGAGIRAAAGSLVENCAAYKNSDDGISIYNQSVARNNQCSENGLDGTGANILADSVRCRVEGNSCSGGPFGIKVAGTQCIIRGNTCSTNATNWSIVAGNYYGPIVDRTAVSPAAVTGNSAASSLGSTDPAANYTH